MFEFSPDFVYTYGLHFLRIIAISCSGWLCARWSSVFIKKKLSAIYSDQLVIELFALLMRYLILFITAMAIMYELSINISALLGAAGVVGIAIGFAAQTSFSNIISGLFLMIEHPFKLGDYIVSEDAQGKVTAINLFAITLTTDDNQIIRIPHEKILKNTIKNVTQTHKYRHDIHLKIAQEQDIDKIILIIEQALDNLDYSLKDPAPVVRLHEVNGDYFELLIGIWTLQHNRTVLKQHALRDISHALAQASIKLYSFGIKNSNLFFPSTMQEPYENKKINP